jgi:WD40 repeat protein
VDLASGRVLHQGRLPIGNAHYAAFSPRGDQVAIVGDGGQVLLLDTKSWRPVAPTASPNGPLTMWVTYSPDGSLLLTVAGDQAVLWDATTGQEIDVVAVPGRASSGSFGPHGTIRIANDSGDIFTWDPSLSHAMAFACQAAGRDITYDEWHAAFPDLAYRKVCTA